MRSELMRHELTVYLSSRPAVIAFHPMWETTVQPDWDARARRSTAEGGHAFERLLRIAERTDNGQARAVAMFVAAAVGYCRFDMYCLQPVDVEISDDMLACLDAVRWGKAPLPNLVADGWERAEAVSRSWGYGAAAF